MKPLQPPSVRKHSMQLPFTLHFFTPLEETCSQLEALPAPARRYSLKPLFAAADVEQASPEISAAHPSAWTPIGQPGLQQQKLNPLCHGDFMVLSFLLIPDEHSPCISASDAFFCLSLP